MGLQVWKNLRNHQIHYSLPDQVFLLKFFNSYELICLGLCQGETVNHSVGQSHSHIWEISKSEKSNPVTAMSYIVVCFYMPLLSILLTLRITVFFMMYKRLIYACLPFYIPFIHSGNIMKQLHCNEAWVLVNSVSQMPISPPDV